MELRRQGYKTEERGEEGFVVRKIDGIRKEKRDKQITNKKTI
jgi:hypothetical protein